MMKRLPASLALVGAAALLLAGCGAGGGSDAAPEEITFDEDTSAKISFSWWGNEDRAARFEEVVALFNQQYPNVEVVRNFNAWGDYWTARNTEAAGKSLPDVVMMDAGYLGEYASKGLLADLSPYRDSLLPLDGVDDQVLGSGTVDDQLVGVPLGTNAWSMMYNKDILDSFGIDYPTDDMTWDEFNDFVLEVNAAGASSEPRIYGAEDFTGGLPNFIYHLMQDGSPVFEENGAPAFDEDDVIEYLDGAADLREDGDFYPVERSVALSPSGGFLAGETAIWFNFSTTVLQGMTDAGTENIGMVQPPLEKGQDEHVLAPKPSMLLSVAKNSDQQQAAAAFVNFLTTSPEVAKIFGTSLGTPPTEAGRDAIDQTAADTVNLDYLASIDDELTASYPILPAGYGTIEAKWGELHEQLRYGDLTTKQFAQELFSEISLVLGS
ncbi:ABC transporter substrate-binding protein [Microbacterium arborescens]|uniref:ABC transporter substrate-binding protein n=1 Tax=Microbacterium arborescens TaxID=33883 RepID=UPI000DF7C2EF|nr:extracellular solute-binding protein [Microbacterium arborescens]